MLVAIFRDSVGLAVLLLREDGDLQKLHKKWWYDKGECAPEGDGKVGKRQIIINLELQLLKFQMFSVELYIINAARGMRQDNNLTDVPSWSRVLQQYCERTLFRHPLVHHHNTKAVNFTNS